MLQKIRDLVQRSSLILIFISFFLVEMFATLVLAPPDLMGLAFGAFWSLLLTALISMMPKRAGRIVYGICYYVILIWTLAQSGYYQLFEKMMWLSDILFALEGAGYLGDVVNGFSLLWWLGGAALLALGVLGIRSYTGRPRVRWGVQVSLGVTAVSVAGLFVLPELVFLRDNAIWGTRSEYAQSSSYRATYNTMYDSRNVYDICGIYQLTFRDMWRHEIYPRTSSFQLEQRKNMTTIDEYFQDRGENGDNGVTGIYEGKNVVFVLMESMDDWLITEEDTPTLCRLMGEGISFTECYTPGYGGARTLNSEFCVNTGIYLPTTGSYVFDYVTNHFNQSLASQLTDNGYTAEVFHYNNGDFYSRGVFEPAMGYHAYNSYEEYGATEEELFSEAYLFDNERLEDLFFREGLTFNTIITRAAHLSYEYDNELSEYALSVYPEYRGKFGNEEIDCARAKAKLVDDLFARLLEELEAHGQLENTVIVGVTDHYTYGFKDDALMMELSGVTNEMQLERTPCFIWSADGLSVEVDKTLNTADVLPTVLNLLGIDSPYRYLGQDAFDPHYEGYAIFPDGSWISDGIVCQLDADGTARFLANENDRELTEEYLAQMELISTEFIRISNLLLVSDYYKSPR